MGTMDSAFPPPKCAVGFLGSGVCNLQVAGVMRENNNMDQALCGLTLAAQVLTHPL